MLIQGEIMKKHALLAFGLLFAINSFASMQPFSVVELDQLDYYRDFVFRTSKNDPLINKLITPIRNSYKNEKDFLISDISNLIKIFETLEEDNIKSDAQLLFMPEPYDPNCDSCCDHVECGTETCDIDTSKIKLKKIKINKYKIADFKKKLTDISKIDSSNTKKPSKVDGNSVIKKLLEYIKISQKKKKHSDKINNFLYWHNAVGGCLSENDLKKLRGYRKFITTIFDKEKPFLGKKNIKKRAQEFNSITPEKFKEMHIEQIRKNIKTNLDEINTTRDEILKNRKSLKKYIAETKPCYNIKIKKIEKNQYNLLTSYKHDERIIKGKRIIIKRIMKNRFEEI